VVRVAAAKAATVVYMGALVTRAVVYMATGATRATGATVDEAITDRVRQSNGYTTVRSIPRKVPPPTMTMQAVQVVRVAVGMAVGVVRGVAV
jgi:hypothetical protein